MQGMTAIYYPVGTVAQACCDDAAGQPSMTSLEKTEACSQQCNWALQAGDNLDNFSAKQIMDTAMPDSDWHVENEMKVGPASVGDVPGQIDAKTSRQAPAWLEAQPRCVGNMRQVQLLFWRAWTSYIRNPADAAGRLAVTAAVAIVIGLVFLGTPNSEHTAYGPCLPGHPQQHAHSLLAWSAYVALSFGLVSPWHPRP